MQSNYNYNEYRIATLNECVYYTIYMRKKDKRGVIYKFRSHDVPRLFPVDKCIEFNLLSNKLDKSYVCLKCSIHDLYVNYTEDNIDVFCLHTGYFCDEILCYIDN